MSTIPAVPSFLRVQATGAPNVGVDRDAKVIRGYIVAQKGPFKDSRGEFDDKSLKQIAKAMNDEKLGLKSRLGHPSLSDDGIGKFLGRARNAKVDGDLVRADLWLSPTSFDTPAGNLGQYVMDLAESDPAALASSLVIVPEKEMRLQKDGTPQLDADGKPLLPLWRVKSLHASDIVDTGAATDGLLSASLSIDGLPDAVVRHGAALLDQAFAGATRDVVEARALAWLARYLDARYADSEHAAPECPPADDRDAVVRLAARLRALQLLDATQ